MSQSPGIVDRYLQLIQEMLINSVYQDRATDHCREDLQARASLRFSFLSLS